MCGKPQTSALHMSACWQRDAGNVCCHYGEALPGDTCYMAAIISRFAHLVFACLLSANDNK